MNHIQKLRKKAGFETAMEAAKVLDISKSMLTKMECNNRRPGIDLAVKMVDVFNCSMDDIFLPYKFTSSEHRDEKVHHE